MPILEISIIPVGTDDTSFSSYITDACKTLEEKGVKYQITPTATIIEGDLEELMDTAKMIHQMPFKAGAHRVITSMTIDDRNDKNMLMEDMVEAVIKEIH